MLRRFLEDGRVAVETNPAMSRTLGVLVKVIVCVAGGTLGWALAHL
jgi:hypothetical protein